MARQNIGIGAAPGDGTGDTLRVGGDKINDNFIECYAAMHWRGPYDASVDAYPSAGAGSGTAGAILSGNMWVVTTAGDLDVTGLGTITVFPGAILIAIVNTPGNTAANWRVIQ